jgi:hypothetical protein
MTEYRQRTEKAEQRVKELEAERALQATASSSDSIGTWVRRAERAEAERDELLRNAIPRIKEAERLLGEMKNVEAERDKAEAEAARYRAALPGKRPPKVNRPRGPSVGEQLRAGREPSETKPEEGK